MAILSSSALTFLNIAYFEAPVQPSDFNQATYSWVEAVQGWATAASNPATFNNANNLNPPTYGYLISPSTGDPRQYVLEVYRNLFGKAEADIDPTSLDYWVNWLTEFGDEVYIGKDGTNYGIANYQALALAVYEYATEDELTALTNRQEVSLAFSSGMQSNPSGSVPTFNTAQYNAGWGIISNVTADPATVTTALAAVDQYVATTGSVDNSFVLTPDVDIEAAGRFLAAPVAGSAGGVLNTFSSGDQLTGVGDNATFTLLWQGGLPINIALVQPDLMENVSTLEATLIGGPLTVLSTFVTGLRNININDTSGNLVMTNLQSPLESVSINRSFLGSDADFTIADAALAGTEDALSIRLNQVTTVGGLSELDISNISRSGGYEQVSVESIGLANTVGMAGVLGVQQLTITGDQDLTLSPNRFAVNGSTSVDRSITTINASEFNADLTMTVADANNSITFNGGLGVDTFTLIGSGNHTLNGGTGNDQFIIAGAATNPGNVNVSGGEGDDVIYFTNAFGGNFTANDVIDGNEGTNTLRFDTSAQAEVIQSNTNTVNTNITSVQELSFADRAVNNGDTLRADLFGTAIDTVTFEDGTEFGDTYTVRFRSGESTININPIDTAPFDISGSLAVEANGIGTGDSLILNLVGRPEDGNGPRDITVQGITLDQNGRFVENLTINANGADTGHSIGGIFQALVNNVNYSITIAGDSPLTLTGALNTNRINASGLTGSSGLTMQVAPNNPINSNGLVILGSATAANTLLGSNENDTITGGSANDIFTGAGGVDILTGAAGVNTYIYNGGSAANAGIANVDQIRDFKAGNGNDRFQFTTGANAFLNGLTLAANSTVNLNAIQAVAAADTLAQVFAGIGAIGASNNATLQAAQIDVTLGAAAGSYLYINNATGAVSDADDYLVEISSFTGLLGAGNFAFA